MTVSPFAIEKTRSPHLRLVFQTRLIDWYDANRRILPWRETRDPYRIWVSEVMLQQTQVKTVMPFYERFIRSFPTLRDLAAADPQAVMKAWEGLGYYGRARALHRAAQEIVYRFDAQIPDRLEALLSLPGIGRYTAGAILSIAFEIPSPVLDGNIIRILSRLFHITEAVDRTKTQRLLWDLAASLLPETRIRAFNEALMELGALVCTPRRPLCEACPLADLCEARRIGIQESLPVRSPKKPIPHFDVTAGVIWKGDRFLITLRPPKGLLGGLWEFPGGKCEPGETVEECLRREIWEELNIEIRILRPLVSLTHAYTHFKMTLHAFECWYQSGHLIPKEAADIRWITRDELDRFAFPAADRKVIAFLKKEGMKQDGKAHEVVWGKIPNLEAFDENSS